MHALLVRLLSKPVIIVTVALIFVISATLGYYFIFIANTSVAFPELDIDVIEEEEEVVEEEEEIIIPVSPYTGLPLEEQGEIMSRPLALMIDNHPSARPQYGLQNASYVYEVVAEGGITRFLAIFHHKNSGNHGPIRSLRPYYAHLARENDAIMAHCGSSVQSKEFLRRSEYANIDEHVYTQNYFRISNRRAPHNLFTDMDNLISVAKQLNIYGKTIETREFEFENGGDIGPVIEVQLPFNPDNNVKYQWDETKKGYLRFVNNRAHMDALEDSQILVDNIIVQYSPYRFISKVHSEYTLVGSGEGLLVRNGNHEIISWTKKGYDQPTYFYDEDGSPIVLVPGNTWIHIISPTTRAVAVEG